MDVSNGLERFAPPPEGIVLSIGNFDGVHRGHVRLIEKVCEVAQRLSATAAVMTFDPHPLAVLAPERAPAVLTTLPEKLALLERAGAQRCLVLHSDAALLSQMAEDFLARLVAHCRPRALVEGPDFNFGRGRSGSIATLQHGARRWDYEVHVVPAVRCEELATHPTISSSSIRQALRDGRISEANAMLGRPYRLVGTVAGGAGRGACHGYPTANLDGIKQVLPQHAVYAAVAQLADGALHLAAVNIGPQPTFGQERARVEAYLLDFDRTLRGCRLGLHLLARLREQAKFASPEELCRQLRQDVTATRGFAQTLAQMRHAKPIALY